MRTKRTKRGIVVLLLLAAALISCQMGVGPAAVPASELAGPLAEPLVPAQEVSVVSLAVGVPAAGVLEVSLTADPPPAEPVDAGVLFEGSDTTLDAVGELPGASDHEDGVAVPATIGTDGVATMRVNIVSTASAASTPARRMRATAEGEQPAVIIKATLIPGDGYDVNETRSSATVLEQAVLTGSQDPEVGTPNEPPLRVRSLRAIYQAMDVMVRLEFEVPPDYGNDSQGRDRTSLARYEWRENDGQWQTLSVECLAHGGAPVSDCLASPTSFLWAVVTPVASGSVVYKVRAYGSAAGPESSATAIAVPEVTEGTDGSNTVQSLSFRRYSNRTSDRQYEVTFTVSGVTLDGNGRAADLSVALYRTRACTGWFSGSAGLLPVAPGSFRMIFAHPAGEDAREVGVRIAHGSGASPGPCAGASRS